MPDLFAMLVALIFRSKPNGTFVDLNKRKVSDEVRPFIQALYQHLQQAIVPRGELVPVLRGAPLGSVIPTHGFRRREDNDQREALFPAN